MTHPASHSPLPPAPRRRLVLTLAALAAIGVCLALRMAVVDAQETKPVVAAPAPVPAPAEKPAAAPKGQSKLEISIGPDGTKSVSIGKADAAKPVPVAKVDAGKSAPVAKAEPAKPAVAEKSVDADAAATTADDDEGAKGFGIRPGKKGKRSVRVMGIDTDRDYDSFGAFAHNEPAIAGAIVGIVALVFLAPVLAIGLILWYRFRKARMLNETMLKLAEKGVVTPGEAMIALTQSKSGAMPAAFAASASAAPLYEQAKEIRKRTAWSDLRKGIIMATIGLGLTLFSILDDRTPNSVGLVLLFVGAGYVVLWWFEERQIPRAPAAVAGSTAPVDATGAHGTGGPSSGG